VAGGTGHIQGWQVFAAGWKKTFFWFFFHGKIVFAGKNWQNWFLPLVGKITVESIFASTKQVRNIVLHRVR